MFFPAFSKWYYILYLLGGLTDAIDGTVARKTGQDSDSGSKFDTIADFVFAIAVTVKIVASLYVPLWLIIWIVIIIAIKLFSHLAGYIKHHEFRTIHSVLNKICGGIVFVIPLFIGGSFAWQAKAITIIAVSMLSTVAAIAEGATILNSKE